MTFRGSRIGLLLLALATCGGRAEDALASARQAYARDISLAYDVPSGKIIVEPRHPGLPDNPYAPLKIGDLFAVRADFPNHDPGPAGFAAHDGRTAFARHPEGLSALVEAFDEKAPSVLEMTRRVMWIYQPPSARLLDGHPTSGDITSPALEKDKSGRFLMLTYFTEEGGNTGALVVWKNTLHRLPGGKTQFRKTQIPTP